MQAQTLDGHSGTSVQIDVCTACQSFWFDARESLALTPGATLSLFRLIGDRVAQKPTTHADVVRCPRCRARLGLAHDMQRTTRFEYLRCPNGHGRLTSFFNFLREKDFIRPLTPQQIAHLRENLQSVNCSNCGAPVDLSKGATCEHCRSPLSMLDIRDGGFVAAGFRPELDQTRALRDDSRRVVCGISFGYADTEHKANSYRTNRAAVSEAATFLDE